MSTTVTTNTDHTSTLSTLMLAFELGETGWLLGFSTGLGQAVIRRKVASRDRDGVLRAIEWARKKLDCPGARVSSCYEAGRDGFWLHRWLVSEGIENRILDSSSIEVNRRKKRAKTDRLDVTKLVGLLARYEMGERGTFSIVSVPDESDEDLRHVGRELKLVKKDRARITNRMKGLLANQGLVIDLGGDLREQLSAMQLWNGKPLPRHLRSRLEAYCDDYDYHTARIRMLKERRRDVMKAKENPATEKAWRLLELKGVGIENAWTYGTEFFGWRDFQNGKQVGSLAGLTPMPYDSGTQSREQGIGKDGSRWVRAMVIEQAWAWLRFQPDSALSQWYQERFGGGSKRLRKIGIVALARKLLIAFWHWVEHGVLPEGAVLKTELKLM